MNPCALLPKEMRMLRVTNNRANRILVVLFAVLILCVTLFVNLRHNAMRYARCSDFDDRLYHVYRAFALFSPSKTQDIAEDIIPRLTKKDTMSYKNKMLTAGLSNGYGFNYFLPLNVLAFSVYLGRYYGFTEPESFSWPLMIGFSGYFLVGVCLFLWALTRTRNWIIVFLAFLSVLPYSIHHIPGRWMGKVDVDVFWVAYSQYVPRGMLTLLLLAMIILISRKDLQKYLIPLSTMVTFWHCGQSILLNGLLVALLLLSLLISRITREGQRSGKRPWVYLKDLLPYPNRKVMICLGINIGIGIAYLSFRMWQREYMLVNWRSPLPKGVVATTVQYFLYALVYCKITVEMVILSKASLRDESWKNHVLMDTGYFGRILFMCVAAGVSVIVLLLLSKPIFMLLGEGVLAWRVKRSLIVRYEWSVAQTLIFGLFLAFLLILQRIYEVVSKHGKVTLMVMVAVVVVFINCKSLGHFVRDMGLVLSSRAHLVDSLQQLDRDSEDDGLDVERWDVFYWTVIKENYL